MSTRALFFHASLYTQSVYAKEYTWIFMHQRVYIKLLHTEVYTSKVYDIKFIMEFWVIFCGKNLLTVLAQIIQWPNHLVYR